MEVHPPQDDKKVLAGREDAGARDRQAAGTATPGRTEGVRSFPVRVSLVERHPVADEVSARSRVGFGPAKGFGCGLMLLRRAR